MKSLWLMSEPLTARQHWESGTPGFLSAELNAAAGAVSPGS